MLALSARFVKLLLIKTKCPSEACRPERGEPTGLAVFLTKCVFRITLLTVPILDCRRFFLGYDTLTAQCVRICAARIVVDLLTCCPEPLDGLGLVREPLPHVICRAGITDDCNHCLTPFVLFDNLTRWCHLGHITRYAIRRQQVEQPP